MSSGLFDDDLRARRRDRALRSGPVLFAHERAFGEVLDRIGDVSRSFASALLIGCPDPGWPERLAEVAAEVRVVDPGAGFAAAAGGVQALENAIDFDPGSFDLCVAIGTLDTAPDLPETLLRLRLLLAPDSLLIGAIAGGDTLPRLRHAMRAADSATGEASPHVHPRLAAAGFAQLLASAGFAMPVVDVDRVGIGYRSLRKLVADLRGMGATNVLAGRTRTPLTRAQLAAAERAFLDPGGERTVELFEIVHFAAWTPAGA